LQRDDRPRSFGDRPRSFGDRPQRDDRPRSFGDRPQRDERPRSFGDRPQRDDRPRSYGDRPDWASGAPRDDRRLPEDLNEPVFDDYDERDLPVGVRAELKGVAPATAHTIGGHLLMVGQLIDSDPALALAHAQAAKRRGGRLQVVREAVAESAYAAGEYKLAHGEYQALYRMTSDANFVPVMADCQRAMGRPAAAIELLSGVDPATLNSDQRVEAVLVAAGARQDLGQAEEAQRLLRTAISSRRGGRIGQARLRFMYASMLEAAGQVEASHTWYEASAELDPAGDGRRRLDELSGKPVGDDIIDPGEDVIIDEEVGEDWFALVDQWDDDTDEDHTDQDDTDEYDTDEDDTDEDGDGCCDIQDPGNELAVGGADVGSPVSRVDSDDEGIGDDVVEEDGGAPKAVTEGNGPETGATGADDGVTDE